MFQNERYITSGIDAHIPPEAIMAMWVAIDLMPDPKSYIQVFALEPLGEFVQNMTHTQEQPDYTSQVYVPLLLPGSKPVAAKVYVIDDGDHATMLLPHER